MIVEYGKTTVNFGNFSIKYKRCIDCRQFYAVEDESFNYTCPYCAKTILSKFQEDNRKMEARIRGYKSYTKNLKNRRLHEAELRKKAEGAKKG